MIIAAVGAPVILAAAMGVMYLLNLVGQFRYDQPERWSTTDMQRYCFSGIVDLGTANPSWTGAELSVGAPVMLQTSPRPIIACAATKRSGIRGYFVVEARCDQPDETFCVIAREAYPRR